MATRLTRAEQGERNRGLVLAAARRVFLERGYAGATLDAIAEEAGFSKGVVYSQFAGKPDLFLALLERRIAERAEQNRRVCAGLAGLAGLDALLQANARLSEDGGVTQRSMPGMPRCMPRPSTISPRRSQMSWPGPGSRRRTRPARSPS